MWPKSTLRYSNSDSLLTNYSFIDFSSTKNNSYSDYRTKDVNCILDNNLSISCPNLSKHTSSINNLLSTSTPSLSLPTLDTSLDHYKPKIIGNNYKKIPNSPSKSTIGSSLTSISYDSSDADLIKFSSNYTSLESINSSSS